MKKWIHSVIVLAALFLFLGIPTLLYVDIPSLFNQTADAVTTASMELPVQPSGEYIVLLNAAEHRDDYGQWCVFFSGEDAGVIMSDIRCMVADGDAGAIQLAERYQARLPENQMQIKRENGLMLASKAACRFYDIIILSKEMADAYQVQIADQNDDVICIVVKGE